MRQTLVASVRLSLCLFVAASLPEMLHAQESLIEITHVPVYGSSENLRGRVQNVDPSAYHVATVLFLEGVGWWTKPTFAAPCTPIGADSRFEVDVTTGGVDHLAHRYAVFLVPVEESCPPVASADCLPPQLLARPSAFVERTPFLLEFSGYTWVRRNSPYAGGPGQNCFSPDHAFVDDQGHLHLLLAPVSSLGFCGGEIWLNRSLGFGRYTVHTIGRVDNLDPGTVLGLFTWDPDMCPAHREMDIELSRWCVAGDPNNAQYVVQPFNQPGHLVRFPIELTDESTELTFLIDWQPGTVTFSTYFGHHFGDPPQDRLVFQHVFADGVFVPGQERFRFNLWKHCSVSQSQEVVVTYFNHASRADLSITKTDGLTTVSPRQQISYTIVVSNAGPSAVTGATVTDTVPPFLAGATWTCAGQDGGTCTASGSGSINDTVSLPVGATATYTLTGKVRLLSRRTLSNTASVAAPAGVNDPNLANNSATDINIRVRRRSGSSPANSIP